MSTEDCLKFPHPRISSHKNPSDHSRRVLPRNAYLSAGVTTLLAILVGTSLLALPIATSAFWPFYSISRAANDGGDPPIVHNSSLPLLEAALNSDPNPEKGASDVITTEDSALMANTGPEGTVADIEHSSPDGTISTYTVKNGDSFSTIAAANGISVNTVLWANNLTSKSTLKPGQSLVVGRDPCKNQQK